jgi:hypothetical protein
VTLLWLGCRLFASTDYQKCALFGKKQGFLAEREKKLKQWSRKCHDPLIGLTQDLPTLVYTSRRLRAAV